MKKNTLEIIAMSLIFIVFFSIAVLVKDSQGGILFDEKIMERVHENPSETMTNIMKVITFLGSSKFFFGIGLVLLFFFYKNKYYEGMFPLFSSIIGTYLVNAILKNIFVRTRPLKYFLIEQTGYSFPSGHSMVSMAFYTTMTYLFLENKKGKNTFIWVLNFLLIGLIGFSRIYLGVHWPTDVIAGYVMGFLVHIIIKDIHKRQVN
ncbi:phosphatase PAP2 family protein [Anaerosalibacter massiliensis]|uniref:Phosphatase PAP2 family protein n=1 Tax=Anaerosalibacter massiliensis TaxID=1347392 RepID=A0A9X2MGB7_9FIRM|nr:phosphatase PAP2 family protein [Anaerosalibacter massiliensis]MCR2043488.1 phosphatase PAP2 family protein [Anaerosalibacter massiliensis]